MDSTVKRTVKETVEAFELKLPKPFDVKPLHTIALPKGYQVLVFDVEVRVPSDANERTYERKPGYRCCVMKNDKLASDRNRGYLHPEKEGVDMISMMLWIKGWAAALSAKKTVETIDED